MSIWVVHVVQVHADIITIQEAFAQTTIPINIRTANRIFTNSILMADKHNIPKGEMYSNCRLLTDHIACKITQRNNMRRANTCDPALKLLNEEITSYIHKHKQNLWKNHLESRCTLGAQAQHTHSLEDHTRSIQRSTSSHTKHFHNIQQPHNNHTQTDQLTEQHIQYKDIISHSPQLRWRPFSNTIQHLHCKHTTSQCTDSGHGLHR